MRLNQSFLKRITALFTVAAMFPASVQHLTPTAAAASELVEFIDFGEGYTANQPLAGQPADAPRKWYIQNQAVGDKTFVRTPAPPYDAVASGKVADFVSDRGGQLGYDFVSQAVECTLSARVFVQPDSLFIVWFRGTAGIGPSFVLENGEFLFANSGDGSGGAGRFTEGKRNIASSGEWLYFEIRGYSSADNGIFDSGEFSVKWGDGPLIKLTPIVEDGKATVRTKVTNFNAFSIQAGTGHCYFDYFKVERTNLLERLDTPAAPRWDGNVLRWDAVRDAASYRIRLFKDGSEVAALPRAGDPGITGTSLDLTQVLREYGYGSYAARITAAAVPGKHKSSLESAASGTNSFVNTNPPLATPTPPVWVAESITWSPVAGAVSYEIDFYRGAVRIKTLTAPADAVSLDLSAQMRALGKGAYKTRLRAVANQTLNTNSASSGFSDPLAYDPDQVIETSDEYLCIAAAGALSAEAMAGGSNLAVTENFNLPLGGAGGVSVSWISDRPEVIRVTDGGAAAVRRPVTGKDVLVTLTGSFTKDAAKYVKMYKFIVKSQDAPLETPRRETARSIRYANYSDTYGSNIFEDVPAGHWAKYYVEYLWTAGIVSGTGAEYFEPERGVKREEACKMLVNLLGLSDAEEKAPFSDVTPDDWFYAHVQAAYGAALAKGVDDTRFGAGVDITRQDLAVMIARTAQYAGADIASLVSGSGENGEGAQATAARPFTDEADIDAYAKESVALLRAAGFVSPNENGGFEPRRTATRAETAKMMCLLYLIN